jgi:hypothetical protein
MEEFFGIKDGMGKLSPSCFVGHRILLTGYFAKQVKPSLEFHVAGMSPIGHKKYRFDSLLRRAVRHLD